MIAAETVSEVRRLLIENNLGQREIACRTGISRGSVRAIASGRRRDNAMRLPMKAIDWEQPVGPPERCSGCGGLVFLPCLVCATRKALARHLRSALRRFTSNGTKPLGLELRPEHRKRYEKLRARRLEWNDAPPAS
jgi:transcriptional regulator with XRE-family HTH domain